MQLKGNDLFNYYYRVVFSDKGNNHPENFRVEQLLSEKAIQRRITQKIGYPDYRDIPVSAAYIDQISKLGFTLHCKSKWMNSALFKSVAASNIALVKNLPFVVSVQLVKSPPGKSAGNDKLFFNTEEFNIAGFDKPLLLVNGTPLHSAGFSGKGILIAVLDGGFTNSDKISSLKKLNDRKGIKATRDFVLNSSYVYDYHNHGTAVMSVLAGQIANYIEGSAPDADYILLRTEDGSSEFPVEEDYWIAGAEFADSAGADIISSSLGYTIFDNPEMNYRYADLDGNAAFITRAADIAASKGIIVVNSAGNERINSWQRIVAPSDGDSVLAVAAIDTLGKIADFSSAGPSADRRIKPDLSALGVKVTVQTIPDKLTRANGTSFACPVLSGMIACLKQAQPDINNIDLINELKLSADKYYSPDSLYGYGIPDITETLKNIQNLYLIKPEGESVLWPNPNSGIFQITLKEQPKYVVAEIYSPTGILLAQKTYKEYAGRTIVFNELTKKNDGVYYVRIKTDKLTFVEKVIKIRN